MSGGVKFDIGKTRYELLPPEFLEGVAQILTFGAKKYADRNWEKGIVYSRAFGALMRHMWAWWRGEDLDQETGKSHLWHAGCELAFLIAFESRGMTHLDDRFKGAVDVTAAGDTVSVGGGEASASEAPPREDEQPVSERHGRQLVQRSDVRLVDRVQVGRLASEVYGDSAGALAEAAGLAQRAPR